MNTATQPQNPSLRCIQARFDASNPDLKKFADTLRKSRTYYLSPCQQNDSEWLVSRFEDGRNPFAINKDKLNVVHTDGDPAWLYYYFDQNTMSVDDAVEAVKTYVQDTAKALINEYRNKANQLDSALMGFDDLKLD